jgi:acetylornithine deacetylase
MELNEERFLGLLESMINVAEQLQNNPAQGLIPKEELPANLVLEVLKPFLKENGGVLEAQKISYVDNRSNLIIKYPGTTDKVCSFVGSHFDVVPANPAEWTRHPFKFSREGDLLYGRGTTDCLGHVAVLTDFFANLATNKPVLKHSIVAVFIANEENGTFAGIGVDGLAKEGYMNDLKNGPLFWIDAADSQPCQGTAGVIQWSLEATGRLFHSGLPHKGINSIEFAMDACAFIQEKFFAEFPRHPQEDVYEFITSSTMKPTQVSCTPGSLNQICPGCTVQGDIRLTPFYEISACKAAVERYVAEINANPDIVRHNGRGAYSKYAIPDQKGALVLKWLTNGEDGVACDLKSKGFEALVEATRDVLGTVKPYSINGSLPLIRELQEKGFDVQISGYGSSAHYHANNECVSLAALKNAAKIFTKLVEILEAKTA